jgi:carbon monoxide dehydrogenase subunit G
MRTFKTSTHIQAPLARTFAVFTDFAHATETVRGIKKLVLLTPGPVRKGTRFKETRVMFGSEATAEMEVVDFQHERSYSFACEERGAYYLTRVDFASDGGGTRVDMSFQIEARGFVAKLMRPLFGLMAKQCLKAFDQDLSDLRRACEGTGGAVAPAS